MVVGSVLAIGTIHVPVLLVVAALALLGATIEVFALRRVPRPALVLAGLGLVSAIQAVPIPAGLVRRLSPAAADVWQRCLVPFGQPPLQSFSLSLDPGASVAEALKWLTYACVYVMATRMRSRRGSAWLALLLFGSATLVALITLAHGVANTTVLYGLYHPDFAVNRWSVGPLLNSNNLAGYAIVGLFSGGGLVLSGRSPVPRLPLLIGLGLIATVLSLSGSRAGVMSALLAGSMMLLWLARSRGTRFSVTDLALGAAPLVIGIVLAVALGSAREASDLSSLDMRRKASVWLWSWPMIREHAPFGVGRGAFETAFPPYRQVLDYDWSTVVAYAENFIVQWVAEWGMPVGIGAVLLVVGYVLREWYRSRRERLRFMVLTGVLALLLQNLADLGLEIPSLAIAAVVALAAGESAAPTLANDPSPRFGRLALLAAGPVLALWVAALVWSRFPVEQERRQMSVAYAELAIKSPSDRDRFRTRLRQAVLRHPGESYFPLLGSLVAMRGRQGDALPWIARSLDLAPTNGPVHLVLAQLLRAHGATTQAMLHLRLAAQYDKTLAGSVSSRAAVWTPVVEELLQAIPAGPYGDGILLDACSKEPQIASRIECFRKAAERTPSSPDAHLQLAETILYAIRDGNQICSGALLEQCTGEAEHAAETAGKLKPHSWRAGYLISKALVARGERANAARLLTRICPQNAEGESCWREAITAAVESGSDEVIAAASAAFAARTCEGVESCANSFASLASYLEPSGRQTALANSYYTKAAETDPSAVRWLKVAQHAMHAQLYGVARGALERAERSPDASVLTRSEGELLRQRIARAAPSPF